MLLWIVPQEDREGGFRKEMELQCGSGSMTVWLHPWKADPGRSFAYYITV